MKNIPQYIADPQYVEGTLLRVEGFSQVSEAQFLNPETQRARVEIEDRDDGRKNGKHHEQSIDTSLAFHDQFLLTLFSRLVRNGEKIIIVP